MQPEAPVHALDAQAAARLVGADLDAGLSSAEAAARLERFGLNQPQRPKSLPYGELLLHQLADPLVALLIAATGVSVAIGDRFEGAAIAAVLVLNAALGFWQELVAERAIRTLSEAFTQSAVVVRDGREHAIGAEAVVPGDLLVLRQGERVAADARVVQTGSLEVDESALTGESLPVEKVTEPVAVSTPLAERCSMAYAGTAVTRGQGRALAWCTGAATELGRIQALAAEAKPPPTPLERRLGSLARQMVVAGVVLTVVLAGAMVARGSALHSAFLLGVAVAVAAVPEGLAAIVTAALALGGRAMARRGAIVRRLEAIETLGETTIICTDKTGTLTENNIRVAALRPAAGLDERDLLRAAVLASSAREAEGGEIVGDPLERALLLAARERGLSPDELLADHVPLYELPFDADRKRMTRVYATPVGRQAFAKGAPERLVEGDLLPIVGAWAEEGFRVLAVAAAALGPDAALDETIELQLEPVGLVALHDPLRANAAQAVAEAKQAGIDVRMITGDHPATARTIGHALGLPESAVLARATPADKLALVEQLQQSGAVVAVTGDGVNDAPALRRADVGIAMGRSGTEAAREAAAIVLTDDEFATIITAVREGRRIGDNIRKFVAFLLSANFGEVLLFALAVTAGLGAPLAVIQVLLVNLITDGLPALALARDPASSETMTSSPRRGTRLFDSRVWQALALIGLLVGTATFTAFLAGRAFGGGVAQTMSFATLALSELALVFAMRSPSLPAWRLPPNRSLSWSVIGSVAVVAGAVYLPAAHEPLATTALGPREALIVLGLAVAPFALVEILKAVRRRRLTRVQTPAALRSTPALRELEQPREEASSRQ
jgi:Ca2+-transporting ATPase